VISKPSSQAGNPHTSYAGTKMESEEAADKMNREALQLKAAQRSADRLAEQLEKLPDL